MEKYDIATKKLIGRGAFGSVYLYQRKSDRKEVVVKEISLIDLDTSERHQAIKEIDIIKRCKHPNIVKYFEHFVDDNNFMIVMEYCSGKNLHEFLEKRKLRDEYLEEDDIKRYFVQIVRGLHYLHLQKILHRDMKTDNLLLDATQKVVKICDFGVAKILTKTNTNTTAGTFSYMSPEVVQKKAYNKKSDVWSLGCILYELITLTRAFDGELVEILDRIQKCKFDTMPQRYSERLKALVKEILNPVPEKRPELTHILASPVVVNQFLDLETYVGKIQIGKSGIGKSPNSHFNSNSTSHSHRDGNSELMRLKSISLEQSSVVYYWTSRNQASTLLPSCGTERSINTEYITKVSLGRTKKLGLWSKGRVVAWENKNLTADSSYMSSHESSGVTGAWDPRILGEFAGHNIVQVCCGDHFVVARSERALLLTWGSGEHGCLGHGTTDESSKAKAVEALIGTTVTQVACGAAHVLALTNDKQVFSWGKGRSGNLGLKDKEGRLEPHKIPLPPGLNPKTIICGPNYSFIITVEGRVFACGDNRKNKLALSTDTGVMNNRAKSPTNEDIIEFTEIKDPLLSDNIIVSIGTGPTHTAFLTNDGRVVMAGSNKHNQLGPQREVGTYRPCMLEIPQNAKIKFIGCGDTYTLGITEDNIVYCWGRDKVDHNGTDEVRQPIEVMIASHKIDFHSFAVCRDSALLAGQVLP